jgi:hypothetical protein
MNETKGKTQYNHEWKAEYLTEDECLMLSLSS